MGQKSDLLHKILYKMLCDLDTSHEDHPTDYGAISGNNCMPDEFDAILWDGGHLIHELPPQGNMVTFKEYAREIL